MRELVNGLLYLLRTGCQWRMLPHDLPPWQTVYYHHRKWRVNGVWEQVNRLLHRQARQQAGRHATPSAAIELANRLTRCCSSSKVSSKPSKISARRSGTMAQAMLKNSVVFISKSER